MRKTRFLFLFLISISQLTWCVPYNPDAPPYWEYGLGIGLFQLEHYPTSDQNFKLLLPFPTFQYRGNIIRADDRQGARAFLLKSESLEIEFSGAAYPALNSIDNKARDGMDNLPWVVAGGPQIIYKLSDYLNLSLSSFQVVSSDFSMTKFSGQIYQSRIHWFWEDQFKSNKIFESGATRGNLFITLKGGSSDFFSIYFDVPENKSNAVRPVYNSKSGFFSQEISYFQTFKSKRVSFYLGGSYNDYSHSVNRTSPMHKADSTFTFLVGLSFVLGESTKSGVPEDETSGVINKWMDRKKPF